MVTLDESLAQVQIRVEQYKNSKLNEEQTRYTLIDPVIRALGWDTEDIDEVRSQFRFQSNDNPVDYALIIAGKPRLFLEAKALNGNLDDRKWSHQIMGYASVAGVEWMVLTDGNEYRIYNSHATVPVAEKLFRTVSVSHDVVQAKETLLLLSKERIMKNELNALWQAYFIDRTVRETIEQLFAPEPDTSVLELIASRVHNLSENDIRASLRRAHIRLDFPSEPDKVHVIASSTPPPGQPPHESVTLPLNLTHSEVKLGDLIEAGIIKSPVRLERLYKGQLLLAEVGMDGTVAFNREVFNSLSMAGRAARVSVIGPAHPANTNGWTFWKFRDSDGQLKEIDVLRQRYLHAATGLAEEQ